MKLVIEIDMVGSAFEDHPLQELKRILGSVPDRALTMLAEHALDQKPELLEHPLRDVNGNQCGTLRLNPFVEAPAVKPSAACPAPHRNGRHEWYQNAGRHYCRACGAFRLKKR